MAKITPEKSRVLIVDDDEKVLALLGDLLTEEGYEVLLASNGVVAIELVKSFDPDLVISDVVMPVVDGFELCRRIKRDQPSAPIPVLLMSGMRYTSDDSMEGLIAGADDYLSIPFRHEELLVKVARLTERRRIERHYREIVEQASDIIYTRTMDGYVTSMNAAGAKFFGKSASEIVGSHLGTLIGSEGAARDIEEMKNVSAEAPLRSTYFVKDHEGNERCLEAAVSIQRDSQHKANGIRGVVRDITEEKAAETALRQSEERYRRLVELSPDAIIVHSDGKFLYVNPAAVKLWGAKSPADLIGRSVLDLVHPDHRTVASQRIREIYESNSPGSLNEARHVRLDGAAIDVEVLGMPMVFQGQNAIQAVVRDITDRKRAREVLRQTETQVRTVISSASLVLFALDRNGVFTLAEGEGLKGLGLKPGELVGQSVFEVYRDVPQICENIVRSLHGEAVSAMVDVGGVTFDARYSPLTDEQGQVIGVIGVATDITDNKKAQQAVQENEERYRELFENANDIIYTHDLAGNFTSLNRSGEQITGFSREEATSMNIVNVLAPEYIPVARKMIVRKTDAQAPTVYELEIITKNKRRVRLEVSTRLIYKDGKPVGVQGIGRDLTERKRSEEVLAQQSQREAMTHRMSQAIRCSLDSSEIFRTAVQELGSYLKADRCSLFMRDGRGNCATNVAEYHVEGVTPAGGNFELEDLRVLIDRLEQSPVLCFNDAANDPRITEVYQRILAKAHVRSIMYVAIKVGDEVTAAFALSTTRELRNWSASDIALATAVADQTGIAIRQAELYQKAEATSKREVLVNSVTMAIRASLKLSEVLSTATRELGIALGASRVHLHLYDPENPVSPVEHEYVAPGVQSISSFKVSYDDPVGLYLLGISTPLIIDDSVNFDDGPNEFSVAIREHARTVGVRSQIDYPLIVEGHFRGVLCIHQTDRLRYWNEDEVSLVDSVAERLGIGIAQAELFAMVAKAKSEWETTFDAMSDGIFIFDRDGRVKRVNRAGAALEALHPRALLGRRCCEILRTTSVAATCVVEKAIVEGRSVTLEVTPDRLDRPILVSVEPVLNEAGTVIAVVATARDLSELRKVEAVAREHQSLLTNILESARESIYAVDMEGRFKWANSATLLALGLKRDRFIGRPLVDLVYDLDREAVNEKLQHALMGEAQTYEMRYFSGDGLLRYARVDNSPLVVDGRTTGVLGIARDITEQKEERERAARADKLRALGQLASGVAHDFNNSLAAILGRAQLLRRQTKDDAQLRNLEIIQTAAEDAAATVRRIQTFARKSPAKEFEILDVSNLLNDAIEITRTRWQNEARLRGLDYEVVLDAKMGRYTFGSASELREVFVNLIVNAVDAMPEGGKLLISSQLHGDRLRLEFTDTGTGMPEDIRQKIFDPFFSTKGAHGTGLGLSVSFSIIERHEGTISVTSELGNGTCFIIELPATEVKTTDEEAPSAQALMPSLSILVIDDEPSVRETLAEMLEVMGHRVMLAESGSNAIQTLTGANCDLVFTDLAMPEMDGWETAREIRKRWPEMNVVLVTGYGTGTLPPPGENNLVNGIIGKPFDFSQISQTIVSVTANQPVLESAGVS
ncbi:MAG TPA: PAS domain S-box protein [Pyrinomonadaceae bacterium]|nr:PAS domain S-box protein [Pyrinomonadaceae bacterium]